MGRKVVGNGCNEANYLSGDPNALNDYCLGMPEQGVSLRRRTAVPAGPDQRRRKHDGRERLDRTDRGKLRGSQRLWAGPWAWAATAWLPQILSAK